MFKPSFDAHCGFPYLRDPLFGVFRVHERSEDVFLDFWWWLVVSHLISVSFSGSRNSSEWLIQNGGAYSCIIAGLFVIVTRKLVELF